MLTTFVCAHNFKINRNISVARRVSLPPACCSSFVIIAIHVLLANIQIAGNQWLPTRAVNRLPYNPCAHLHPLHPHIYPCSAPSLAYLWRVLLSVLFFSAVVDWKLYALLSIKAVPICTVRHKSWLCLVCRRQTMAACFARLPIGYISIYISLWWWPSSLIDFINQTNVFIARLLGTNEDQRLDK